MVQIAFSEPLRRRAIVNLTRQIVPHLDNHVFYTATTLNKNFFIFQ